MTESKGNIPEALLAVELERLSSSTAFRRSPRQVRLLRYLLAEMRAGRASRLKESVIAVEVFDRRASTFDGRADTTVRVEMGRLRRRLARYYAEEGAWAALQIELPVGSYVPVLRARQVNGAAKLPSIAVLPFSDLGEDATQTPFADGLTDEITDALAQMPGVKVVARTSAGKYRGVMEDVRAIGNALGVATLLEGSVQGRGEQLRVVAQWVRTSDGYHAWSRAMESMAGETPQEFKERVARDIVSGLQRRLLDNGGGEGIPLAMPFLRRAANLEAQDAYDRARYLLRLDSVDGYTRAVPLLRRALEFDPQFASAHCALARALVSQIGVTAVPALATLREARVAVDRALDLDPELGEAHTVQGFIAFAFDHDWPSAERAHLRGIRFAPSLPYSHAAYAWALMFNRRFAEADAEYRFARELDPLDLKIRAHHALNFLYAGQDDQAVAELDAILEVEPNQVIARALRAAALLWRGDASAAAVEYRQLLESYPDLTIGAIGLAQAEAMSGNARAARRRLIQLQHKAHANLPPYQVAMIHARLDNVDGALEWLDRAARECDMNFVCAPLDRTFASLHGDSRFAELMARHGLGAIRASGAASAS
ncbi:MAG TPA: hypothetical protein VFB54_11430 [Burkholderiales bacterium]|nr:hypothetical protein [Burkholderiales bacterium]